jgi:rhodanese-related sulfurtransferase
MPRPHAPFCDLNPDRIGHGQYCISRPVARQAVGTSEQGKTVDITVDLAALWSNLGASRVVRVISEPPHIDGRFVVILASGTARQLAAALLVAAGQAEELERDVSRPRPRAR